MIVIRRLAVSLLLYGVLVALLWFNLFWGPFHTYFMENVQLELIFVCFCALTVAIALMLLPGYGAIKLLLIVAAGMYFGGFGGIQFYFSDLAPMYLDGKLFILGICAISVGVAFVYWLFGLGLWRRGTRLLGWVGRLDARQQGVVRAGLSTVVWIVVLAFWASLHDGASNPLEWLPANIGFVLLFFVYECLRGSGIAEAPILRDQPAMTFLSPEDVEQIREHVGGERPAVDQVEEPLVQARSA